ncbi:protein PAT1 homolog 1 isoform X2 [Syngnathoides biaculeatus]|uniref:protein PAT1 homolog 1 isoform X2 n=1 Tax=Syngnathoides biaculeatus TaxID=300417 RepID=UPI002ADE01CC|nr:protein PAT1 homolog 1 isoform X2 [Syngnathoides biaculeatus]
MFRFQSLDDDCTLEEEVDGLVEEEDEIDQFNDDTFGAGAVDDDWQEEHKRLAELDERDELGEGLGLAVGVKDESELGDDENSSSTYVTSGWGHLPFHPPRHSAHHSSSGVEQTDLEDGRRESDLAESLARMVLDADPAIAGVGTAERPISSQNQRSGHDSRSRALHQPSTISHSPYPHQHPQQHQRPAAPSTSGHSPSSMLTYQQQQHLLRSLPGTIGQMNSRNIWENRMGFGPVSVTPGLVTHMELPLQDSPLMSIIKEVGLPKRPSKGQNDGRDLSERVPPPRSSSPVIGSPPVRAMPIGTPPKQPMGHSLNHQIHHPTAVHVRANIQQRYPPPFPERLSPNTLLNFSNAPLCRGPFPPGISPVLSQIQRAQLLNSQVAGVPCGGPVPPLVPAGGGFRPFFSGPHPTHSHRMAPLHSHGHPSHMPPLRHNATHLHPQHRRILTQRMQNRGGDRSRTGGDWRSRDPYSNLMTQKEKEWVTKIQMMQLQSTDPFLDDYYYQHYYEKMEKRQEKERDSSKKEHTTKLITPQVAKIEHTYRPVQFAGSLGKLTVSSVNNPRKMIDAVVTTRSDDEEKREKQVWNKRRQILYTVEKIYSLLLEVQDFEKRYVHAPEEDRESLLEQHKTNTVQLCNSLQEKEWDDRVSDERCVMIMSVRKGKRLISRLLPYLPTSQAAAVVMAIARNLPTLAKKDKQDQLRLRTLPNQSRPGPGTTRELLCGQDMFQAEGPRAVCGLLHGSDNWLPGGGRRHPIKFVYFYLHLLENHQTNVNVRQV